LTRAGHALHSRLLKAVITFNQQLRTGLSSDEIETLRRVLTQLRENVA
jgi:DNA-binding MarR family transcriptional regulator